MIIKFKGRNYFPTTKEGIKLKMIIEEEIYKNYLEESLLKSFNISDEEGEMLSKMINSISSIYNNEEICSLDKIIDMNDNLLNFYVRNEWEDFNEGIKKFIEFIEKCNTLSLQEIKGITFKKLGELRYIITQTDKKFGTRIIDTYNYIVKKHTKFKGKTLDMLITNDLLELEKDIDHLNKIVEGREI